MKDESKVFSKLASTLTVDFGCEYGGGVHCNFRSTGTLFVGFMAYTRAWFDHDHYAVTLGGGAINNPGRYLVLLPPVNGATAFSGTPAFTENPGDKYKAWDTQVTFDYMPSQYITFRAEFTYRHASVPYFAGAGGVTPPGGNQGAPGSIIDADGDGTPDWLPDLVKSEPRMTLAMMVKL